MVGFLFLLEQDEKALHLHMNEEVEEENVVKGMVYRVINGALSVSGTPFICTMPLRGAGAYLDLGGYGRVG